MSANAEIESRIGQSGATCISNILFYRFMQNPQNDIEIVKAGPFELKIPKHTITVQRVTGKKLFCSVLVPYVFFQPEILKEHSLRIRISKLW